MLDFGTGGLDLAYEVMRGYDALILVDISRQGGEPGTLYVMEPDPEETSRSRTARCQPARHGPADRAAVREDGGRLAGQGHRGRLRARRGRGDGPRPLAEVADAVERRSALVFETIAELAPTPPTRRPDVHELSLAERDRRHGRAPRRRPPGDASSRCGSAPCDRSSPTRSPSTSRSSRATRSARAPASTTSWSTRSSCPDCGATGTRRLADRGHGVGAIRGLCRRFGARTCDAGGEVLRRSESSRSSRSTESSEEEDDAPHQGEGRRGRPRRERDDRARQPRRLRPASVASST